MIFIFINFRLGGVYAYAVNMSPERRRLFPKHSKSRSPHRNKRRSQSRSRTRHSSRSLNRSKSPRKNKKSDYKRSSSPRNLFPSSRSYRKHLSRSRSKDRNSYSKSSDDGIPLIEQKLLNRLKKPTQHKIQINIPKILSPPVYRIRNASDSNSFNEPTRLRSKHQKSKLEENESRKSRWDSNDSVLKKLPPPLINAPQPPRAAHRSEFLNDIFINKENGDEIKTTSVNVAELEAEAQRLSDFSVNQLNQPSESDIKNVVLKALNSGTSLNIDEVQQALNEKFKAILSQPPPMFNAPPPVVNLCGSGPFSLPFSG